MLTVLRRGPCEKCCNESASGQLSLVHLCVAHFGWKYLAAERIHPGFWTTLEQINSVDDRRGVEVT